MQKIISQIVESIKRNCNPEKIILFGSYVQGGLHRDSDIDLLIVKDSDHRRDERDREIRDSLRQIKFPLDIFVYTPEEVEKFSHQQGSFIHEIFTTGKVIYEK